MQADTNQNHNLVSFLFDKLDFMDLMDLKLGHGLPGVMDLGDALTLT